MRTTVGNGGRANDSSIPIPMIYTPAKLRSGVLPRRNTMGLVIIVRARCIKPRSIGRPFFAIPRDDPREHVIARVDDGASRVHGHRVRLLHYFRHNRIRSRFIGSSLNRYIGRARKDDWLNEFFRWKFVHPQNLSLIQPI